MLRLLHLVNSWFLVGSISALFTTPYGQLLAIKLFLVAGMLGFAALNRFWLVPSLIRNAERHDFALAQLRRHVLGEQPAPGTTHISCKCRAIRRVRASVTPMCSNWETEMKALTKSSCAAGARVMECASQDDREAPSAGCYPGVTQTIYPRAKNNLSH